MLPWNSGGYLRADLPAFHRRCTVTCHAVYRFQSWIPPLPACLRYAIGLLWDLGGGTLPRILGAVVTACTAGDTAAVIYTVSTFISVLHSATAWWVRVRGEFSLYLQPAGTPARGLPQYKLPACRHILPPHSPHTAAMPVIIDAGISHCRRLPPAWNNLYRVLRACCCSAKSPAVPARYLTPFPAYSPYRHF